MSLKTYNPQPQFIIIGGPNGAGKSITSENILEPFGIKAFDWDKEFELKWKQFDSDPSVVEGIREATNSDFNAHIEAAFSENISVSYETNFHSSHNFELAQKARQNGFYNRLYFLAITDPELALERVKLRVRKGGHNVSEAIIRERFKLGLWYLDQAPAWFDSIIIYNSSARFDLQLIIEDQKVVHKSNNIDSKIMGHLPNLSSI